MKDNIINLCAVILAAIVLLVCAVGCSPKINPSVTDSTFSSYVKKDTVFIRSADSSMVQYLIECEKTANGYKARIVQLMNQKPGDYLHVPTVTVNDNVLTTTAYLPAQKIYVPVYRFYSSSIKAKVYVKITNELTWLQQGFVYLGYILLALVVGFIAYKVIRRYTGFKIPFEVYSKVIFMREYGIIMSVFLYLCYI